MLDQLLLTQLMNSLTGKGGNTRLIFRTMMLVKRNQIFWELDQRVNPNVARTWYDAGAK
jgi:hypothetical protein